MTPIPDSTTGKERRGGEIPNVWSLSSDRNPYLHNVFALLGLDPDEAEQAFQSRLRRISRQIEAGQQLSTHGRTVQETDVARAHHLTAHELHYVAERLLAHTVHKVDPATFQQAMESLESLRFEEPESLLPLAIRDPSFLTRLLPQLEMSAVSDAGPPAIEQLHELTSPDPRQEQIYGM